MPGRKHSAEQIIRKLREAEVELAKGHSIKVVCKKLGVTDQTYSSPEGRKPIRLPRSFSRSAMQTSSKIGESCGLSSAAGRGLSCNWRRG